MPNLVSFVTQVLSILTIIGQAIIVFCLIGLLFKKSRQFLVNFLGKNAYLFSFVVAATAMAGSLFFSEVAHYTPCILCWYQRIAMYPQAILLGIGLTKKDKSVIDYTIWLAIIGAIISAYNYLLQIGAAPATSCLLSGQTVSCSEKFVMNFGYITISLMAFTAFLMLIILAVLKKFSSRS